MKKSTWIIIAIIILVVIGAVVFFLNSQGIGEALTEQLQQFHQSRPQH